MASPPFIIDPTTPGDNDIVSQFPANERSNRDNVKSWFLVNHDTNGDHLLLEMPFQGSTPTTPSASRIRVYADAGGRLRILFPDGTIGFVGIPPASIIFNGSSAIPVGYLVADGSAVSRSTYSDLFTAIGTTYGAGDGSTTFNLPDIKGRVIAGEDPASLRLTATYFGTANPVAGAVGGAENFLLTLAHIPTGLTSNGSNSISVSSGGTTTVINPSPVAVTTGGFAFGFATTQTFAALSSSGTNNIAVTSNNTGGTAHRTVQPTIVQKALIKT